MRSFGGAQVRDQTTSKKTQAFESLPIGFDHVECWGVMN